MTDSKLNTGDKVKEIYRTEYIDKTLPTIKYIANSVGSLTEGSQLHIEVSGRTSEEAFIVFMKVAKEMLVGR